jgi:tripartite-type tricarboxylate transporter receptor subunit TctC
VRLLAVTTATRAKGLPDIPTLGEFVAGYDAHGWVGIGVPRNTPVEIIYKLNSEINASLADPSNRGKSVGSQPEAQRCRTMVGKYGTSGGFGTASRAPR